MSTGLLVRLIAVGSFASAPLALNTAPATPAIFTGDASAEGGPGVGFENTGGNVQGGIGRSESRVVIGQRPATGPAVAPLATPVVPKAPGADALARARAQVDAAKAFAQAHVDAAKARAVQAQQRAHQQADEAQARSRNQSNEARSRSDANSASSSSSSYTDDDD